MKFLKRTQRLDWEKNCHHDTRREFIKKGLATGIWFAVPSAVSQLFMSRQALADGAFGGLYIVQVDLENGYASHGQFQPQVASGSLSQEGLTQCGVQNNRLSLPNSLYTDMGLPFFGTASANLANTAANAASFTSKLAQGVVQNGNTAIARTRAAAVMLRSADDTNANAMSLASALVKAGSRGQVSGNFSNSNAQGGISHQELIAGTKAGFARNIADIENAAKIGGLGHLPEGALNELVNGIERLSQRDLAKLNRLSTENQVQTLASDTFLKSKRYVNPAQGLDARNDADARTAFGITTNTATTDQTAVIASLMSGLFLDLFGVVSIRLQEYDYHNTGTANTEAKDLAAGRVIGSILRYANLKQKNVLVVVTSAGSVGGGSNSSNLLDARAWNGDRGTNSAALMFYHQAGTGAINQLKTQLGYFLNDGGTAIDANPNDVIRGDVRKAMAAIVANALILARKEEMMETLFPALFTRSEFEKLRMFAPA